MAERKKKKTTGGQHQTSRTPVQMPTKWLAVARELAKANRQPTVWWLIGLIEREAKEAKVSDLPSTPWDKGTDS